MIKRIFALALIIACTSMAWFYLSLVMDKRSSGAQNAMSDAVGGLWGTPHAQMAPAVKIDWEEETRQKMKKEERRKHAQKKQKEENAKAFLERRAPRDVKLENDGSVKITREKYEYEHELSGSSVTVNLDLDHRKKGLIWFSTYKVEFEADYTIENPLDHDVNVTVVFPFPSSRAVYDNMKLEAPGCEDFDYHTQAEQGRRADPLVAFFTMEPESVQEVKFSYKSRGLNQWTYRFGESSQMVKNFKLLMYTDFDEIDFPADSISPDEKEQFSDEPGWVLTWDKESLVSAFHIGMVMPKKLNPGPLASAMSRHAPVSMLFFFFVMFLLQVMRGIKIHPMNYFFVACGFFSFNILFSYLVDHLDLKLSFLVSSMVSIFLVVSYLQLVVSTRFALVEAGMSQFIYQIMFAFAHFHEGYTGLAVTVGAILTLAVVMRLTGRIDWEEKFRESDWGVLPRRGKGKVKDKIPINSPAPPRG